MDPLLHMGPLEQDYWSSPSTRNTLRIVDTLGLTLGLCFNTAVSIAAWSKDLHCTLFLVASTLQLAQLIWLYRYQHSYMRSRNSITFVQRVRWLIGVLLLFAADTPHLYTLPKYTRMEPATVHAGSIQAFGTVLLVQPVSGLLASVNHPLPFKHQIAMSVITVIFYTSHMLHHQVAAVDIFQLQGWVEPTCRKLQAAMLPPLPSISSATKHICSHPGNTSFLMMYVFILVAALLPLHLHYWHENASKAAWLKARGVIGPRASPTPVTLRVLYSGACSIIAWGVLAMYVVMSSQH